MFDQKEYNRRNRKRIQARKNAWYKAHPVYARAAKALGRYP